MPRDKPRDHEQAKGAIACKLADIEVSNHLGQLNKVEHIRSRLGHSLSIATYWQEDVTTIHENHDNTAHAREVSKVACQH